MHVTSVKHRKHVSEVMCACGKRGETCTPSRVGKHVTSLKDRKTSKPSHVLENMQPVSSIEEHVTAGPCMAKHVTSVMCGKTCKQSHVWENRQTVPRMGKI